MSGEGLAAALRAKGVDGSRILLARAEQGRGEITVLLEAAGAFVEDVAAYRTESSGHAARPLLESMRREGIIILTFASPSAVDAFAGSGGFDGLRTAGRKVRVVTIGATTTAALRARGIEPDGEAQEASFGDLAATAARVARTTVEPDCGRQADGRRERGLARTVDDGGRHRPIRSANGGRENDRA